jgi:hypothetical protein
MTNDVEVQNDTRVFYAMHVDKSTWQPEPTMLTGTPDAIHRDGMVIDPNHNSELYCPHQWIDDRGYVDLELSRKHLYPHSLKRA